MLALLVAAGCASDNSAKGKAKPHGKQETGKVDSDFVLRGGFR